MPVLNRCVPAINFVRAAAGVNYGAGVAIIAEQTLVGADAECPHDRVTAAIGGSHKGRAATAWSSHSTRWQWWADWWQ